MRKSEESFYHKGSQIFFKTFDKRITMRVYITDLEAYNNGHLVGAWYTLPMSSDELAEAIENELYKGKQICGSDHHHEEYFLSDYECYYMKIDEYSDLERLNVIAEDIGRLDEHEQTAVKLLLENYVVSDIEEAIENIDNMHCTGESKMEDVAYNYIEETGALKDMPENLQFYFNYEALGRDMEINGSFYTDENGIIWEYMR